MRDELLQLQQAERRPPAAPTLPASTGRAVPWLFPDLVTNISESANEELGGLV